MRHLFEEYRITKKPLHSNSKTTLEISFHQKQCSSVQSDLYMYFTACPLSSPSRILAIRSSVVKAVNIASTTSPTSLFLFPVTCASSLFSAFFLCRVQLLNKRRPQISAAFEA